MTENLHAGFLSLKLSQSLPDMNSSSDLTWVAFTAFVLPIKASDKFQSIKTMETLLIAVWL